MRQQYPKATDIFARRLAANPIITPEMLPAGDGGNINGPSLIRVPEWIQRPLGKYYLYFSHHGGSYIRMASADNIAGPWKNFDGGVLDMSQLPHDFTHIASPDIYIDESSHELRMYFHGYVSGAAGQDTYVAISKDGINFTARPEVLGTFYFRVFTYKEKFYAVAKSGILYSSDDGFDFTEQHYLLDQSGASHPRHLATDVQGDTLWLYHSDIGDMPERILRSEVDLTRPLENWRATNTCEILKPELKWEGTDLPLVISQSGKTDGENALRDPGIFNDPDSGKKYLIYSYKGETGLAIAELCQN